MTDVLGSFTACAAGRVAGDYRENFRPLEREIVLDDLPVEGTIPGWLAGTLIRNGPAIWQVGAMKLRHWFDGLAMLHRFGLQDGRVSYANRFVESPQYLHAQRHGTLGYSEFATDPCRSIFKRLTTMFWPAFGHNTSVSVHKLAGRFVALTETPLPIEFDPETLRTVGVLRYDDAVEGVVTTPHPHLDRTTGDALNTITRFSRECSYNIFRIPAGLPRRDVIASLPAREPAYMHSFSVTERYLVLAEYPLVVSPLRVLMSGKPFAENLRWVPERPTRFHVIDKCDGALVATRESAAFFSFHHVNAFEREGEVFVDLLAYPDASGIRKQYLDVLCRPDADVAPASVGDLRRYRVPLTGGQVSYEPLTEEPMELPRIDYERFNGREYAYAYGVGCNRERPSGWVDQLVKADVRAGTTLRWHEPGCYPGEPIFVAAPSARAEDDGVILSVVLDAVAHSSFLVVLDARTLTEIGRAIVPHQIPYGFHGQYFGDPSS